LNGAEMKWKGPERGRHRENGARWTGCAAYIEVEVPERGRAARKIRPRRKVN